MTTRTIASSPPTDSLFASAKPQNSQQDVTSSTLGSRIIRVLPYLVEKIRVILQTTWINSFRNDNMHVRNYQVHNTSNKYTQLVPQTSSRLSSRLPSLISGLSSRWPRSTHRALREPRPPLSLAGLCGLETACLSPSDSLDAIWHITISLHSKTATYNRKSVSCRIFWSSRKREFWENGWKDSNGKVKKVT